MYKVLVTLYHDIVIQRHFKDIHFMLMIDIILHNVMYMPSFQAPKEKEGKQVTKMCDYEQMRDNNIKTKEKIWKELSTTVSFNAEMCIDSCVNLPHAEFIANTL